MKGKKFVEFFWPKNMTTNEVNEPIQEKARIVREDDMDCQRFVKKTKGSKLNESSTFRIHLHSSQITCST